MNAQQHRMANMNSLTEPRNYEPQIFRGTYDQLNRDTPIQLKTNGVAVNIYDLDALMDAVFASNYGFHRLLSAMVRKLARDPKSQSTNRSWLYDQLKDYFDHGGF